MKKLISTVLFLSILQIGFAQTFKDCETAYQLCGESPFYIENTIGVGEVDEGIDTTCLTLEFNSTWIKWTVIQGGTLVFRLEPSNENQDLDFLVFKFNAVDDCEDKELIRCMASGENVGQPQSTWEICTGATGLQIGETDTVEYAGCASTDNNFLAPIEANEGDQYVMLVNEFGGDEIGFELSFGGSAVLDCITVPVKEVNVNSNLDFKITPTLTTGKVSIELQDEDLLRSQITIFNVTGQKVYSNKVEQLEFNINLTHLPKGTYIATVQNEGAYLSKKFWIVK